MAVIVKGMSNKSAAAYSDVGEHGVEILQSPKWAEIIKTTVIAQDPTNGLYLALWLDESGRNVYGEHSGRYSRDQLADWGVGDIIFDQIDPLLPGWKVEKIQKEVISKHMNDKHISRRGIAIETGFSDNRLDRILNGRNRLSCESQSVISRFCTALKTDQQTLLGEIEQWND